MSTTGSFRRWIPDVIVSLNELEFTVRKAVRGAGYHWGEAEEAGKAAVWLARHGLPVVEPLLTVLHAVKRDPGALRPILVEGHLSQHGPLCPLLTGIAIADGALRLTTATRLTFEQLWSPVLLIPFLALAASDRDCAMTLEWPGGKAALARSAAITGSCGIPPDRPVTATLLLTEVSAALWPPSALHSVLDSEAAAWDALNGFAAETYVPATDRSRRAGAGAGLADND